MILSDIEIKEAIGMGLVGLNPLPTPADIQSASVDVHLGNHFLFLKDYNPHPSVYLDTHANNDNCFIESLPDPSDGGVFIPPGGLVLATLMEKLTLPNDIACQLGGKSSIGRLGLQVHATAGWIDPGWDGYLTLELTNLTKWPIKVHVWDKIAQLIFMRLSSPARETYDGKYQHASKAEVSRTHFDYR